MAFKTYTIREGGAALHYCTLLLVYADGPWTLDALDSQLVCLILYQAHILNRLKPAMMGPL